MLICRQYIFFGKVSVKHSVPIFNQVVWVLIVTFKSSFFILDNTPLSDISCKYFLPVCDLSSHSLDVVLGMAKVSSFNEGWLVNDFFHGLCLWCCI